MCLKSFAPDALKPESRRGESSYLLEPVRAIRPTCFATLPAPSTNSPAHTDHGRLPRERNRCWTLFSGPRSMRARQETVRDRKSTRLNSSHTVISYAVFCLKKKKKKY